MNSFPILKKTKYNDKDVILNYDDMIDVKEDTSKFSGELLDLDEEKQRDIMPLDDISEIEFKKEFEDLMNKILKYRISKTDFEMRNLRKENETLHKENEKLKKENEQLRKKFIDLQLILKN